MSGHSWEWRLFGMMTWSSSNDNQALTHCCFKVGPPSATMAQHNINISNVNPLTAKLFNLNFLSLEVVSR